MFEEISRKDSSEFSEKAGSSKKLDSIFGSFGGASIANASRSLSSKKLGERKESSESVWSKDGIALKGVIQEEVKEAIQEEMEETP